MKRKLVTLFLVLLIALSIATISIIARGNKTTSNTESTESNAEIGATIESLPWLQLSSIESHPELRKAFDEYFGVTGTVGNKEGGMYTNSLTQKTDQNKTLFLVMTDYNFRQNFLLEKPMMDLGNIALENYADIEVDDVTAPYAAINAYFELLPDQEEGQFDGDATISRAQAMTLVMRAVTPVNEAQAPEVDAEFTTAVGSTEYTDFAAPMNEYAYINTNTGLNEGVFSTAMSKGEYICMVTNLLAERYDEAFAKSGLTNKDLLDAKVSVVADAGNISYAEAIKDDLQGVPSDMFATFTKAVQYGLIQESLLEDWSSSITKAEAIELFMDMTNNYVTRCQDTVVSADNTADEIEEAFKNRPEYVERQEITQYALSQGYSKTKDWVHAQGADYWSGWTVIYENCIGAGHQPSYGVYMKEGDLYGTVYHVGDILPSGNQLQGTDAEWDAWKSKDLLRRAEEYGDKVIREDGKVKIIID